MVIAYMGGRYSNDANRDRRDDVQIGWTTISRPRGLCLYVLLAFPRTSVSIKSVCASTKVIAGPATTD